MITRIKINGFKSLVNVDVELGPFTCIAGTNAVGKSNFFDALMFLGNLADKTFVDAAKSVRSDDRKYASVKDIFHKSGNVYSELMKFEIDLLLAKSAEDDLGQPALASKTSVQYILELRYNASNDENPIVIEREELRPIPEKEARKSIKFSTSNEWRKSAITGRKTTPFISTVDGKIKIHQDLKETGMVSYQAGKMQRTLLSSVTAEYPTAFMVRHEFRSWKMLQLEPSALRKPDDFDSRRNAQLGSNGAHLAATLYRLHNELSGRDIYGEVTTKLSGIIDGLDYVSVDKDEKRELLTLQVKYKGGAEFQANTLSDGTLRFLGLTVLELDNTAEGLICFEEPENGIHPLKIAAIIRLLERIAVDTAHEIDSDNPFRQVVINTHSPLVVSIVPEDSLLMAELEEGYDPLRREKYQHTVFKGLSGTWRTEGKDALSITKGTLLNYLSPLESPQSDDVPINQSRNRVKDRKEVIDNHPRLSSEW